MGLRERVRALEQVLDPAEGYRLLYVADSANQEAEITRYREETGYRGHVVCIDETDARL